MAKLDFPDASYSPWVAPNNVIYTYIGTSPNGYWEANTANASTNLTAVFVERTGSTMTGTLISGLSGAGYGYQLNHGNTNLGGLYKDTGSSRLILGDGSTTKIDLQGSSGAASFSGAIGTSGQNTVNEASTLKFSQESGNLSQIRAYGSNASTSGSLEFKVGPSTGAPSTPLTLTSGGAASFAGDIQATKPRSSTAGSTTGGLSINPSDSTIYYNFRVDEVDNGLHIDTTAGANRILFSNDGDATFEGNVAASNLNCSGSVDVGNPSTNAYKQGFLAVPTPSSGGSYFQVYGKNGDVNKAFSVYNGDLAVLTASIDSTGAASFAGPATVVNASTPTAYTRLYDGHMLISNTTAFGQAFGLYNTTTSAYEIAMFMDGRATFAGAVESQSYFKVTNTGIAYLQPNTVTAFQAYESSGPATINLNNNGSSSFAADASINGLTVGHGPGNVSSNTVVGETALVSSSGGYNTAVGHQAMRSNTTGEDHVSVGWLTLYHNTTGHSNTAIGRTALYSNTTGTSNVAIGRDALRLNTTGSTNTSIGRESSYSNTTGQYNTVCGYQSLYNNSTGYNNSAFGYKALANNSTGTQNTAVGYEAMRYTSTGGNNVAIGLHAMYGNSTGYENVAAGVNALISNSTGAWNTALGYKTLEANTTANHNTAVGRNALISNTTGTINTAVGSGAMFGNTVGNYNTGIGYSALSTSSTGDRNVAIGYQTLFANTSGGYATAVGMYAGYYNTTGMGNDAYGYNALHHNTTGHYNTALGYQSLHTNTTGHRNSAFGLNALYYNTTGTYNVGLGREALNACTTGSANIGIGGTNSTGTFTPPFNVVTESNRLVLGHTSITNAYVKVAWTVTSDERDKMNFAPVPYGLDFVNQLKPTAYQFKVDRDTETPDGDVRYGFKAQDILALEGNNPVIIDIEDPDHLKYKGEHLVPVLVNAVQELTTMVKELQAEIKTLKG